MSKFTCKCGFCGEYDQFTEEWNENEMGEECAVLICPSCGRAHNAEDAFPEEYDEGFEDDWYGDEFCDPEDSECDHEYFGCDPEEARREAMMDYIHSGAGLDAFYADDACCGGRW